MSDQTKIAPSSDQWIYVNFRLQMMLGSPQVQLLSLRKHSITFLEQYQSYLKIQAGVDLTDMEMASITSIKDSLRKDLILRAGRVNINLENAKNKKYRMMLLKVAISQTLPSIKQQGLSVEDFLQNQGQFDAVYMSPRFQQLSVFTHQYMVRDPKQYQWQYDAEFVIAQKKDWSSDKIICANCKIAPAKYYCPQDQQSYCWPCFGDLHRSERKSKHAKEPLSPFNCPPVCQKGFHENQPLNHYCFTCKLLKCKYCLNDSQHKKNSEGAHLTIECRQFAQRFRNVLQQRLKQAKNRISDSIREIQSKIQLISKHYNLRVDQFNRAFEQRVATIREWATSLLNIAVGLHSELKRKYDETIWLETLNGELQKTNDVQMNMLTKEGITSYLGQCFSDSYFLKIEKRVQGLKIFS